MELRWKEREKLCLTFARAGNGGRRRERADEAHAIRLCHHHCLRHDCVMIDNLGSLTDTRPLLPALNVLTEWNDIAPLPR